MTTVSHLGTNLIVFLTSVLTVYIIYTVIVYNWKRRWLYYYASKFPGPFNFPLIGIAPILGRRGRLESYNTLNDLCTRYSPICKAWLGPDLIIGTSRPQDFEIMLPKCSEKAKLYTFFKDYFENSMLIAPVTVWRDRRKMINQCFNNNVLNTFVPLMAKHAKNLRDSLDSHDWKEDMFPKIWKYTFHASCETIADVKPEVLTGIDNFLSELIEYEDDVTKRVYNPLLHPDFLWKISRLGKKASRIAQGSRDFVQQLLRIKRLATSEETSEPLRQKRFLNFLVYKKFSQDAIFEETPFMLAASSETSSIVISSLLLILGMHSEIQEKIFEVLNSIFGDSDRDITVDDLEEMDYLERVIKETLRIFPGAPFIGRFLESDVTIDSKTFPAGANIIFNIAVMHRRADLWPDPLKFDPDRFLPEEIEKRHRCAFMPFSYGSRNCIGLKYAMLSMMITAATILRSYKVVESVDYKRIEDVDLMFYVVGKAKKGYRVRLKKRTK